MTLTLSPEEKLKAQKYLRYLYSSKRRGFPAIPLLPYDPLAILCSRYLAEIGWRPGDEIPSHLKPKWWRFWE